VKKTLISLLIICMTSSAFGQDTTVRKKSGPRRQLATILFAGLGGAILGLSTLSFYGRPQDYLGNIGLGFAAGVIVGTIYVTYKSATTKDYSDSDSAQNEINEQKFLWAPMIAPQKTDSTALGGQFALRF
jgi:hypothetical protein